MLLQILLSTMVFLGALVAFAIVSVLRALNVM